MLSTVMERWLSRLVMSFANSRVEAKWPTAGEGMKINSALFLIWSVAIISSSFSLCGGSNVTETLIRDVCRRRKFELLHYCDLFGSMIKHFFRWPCMF